MKFIAIVLLISISEIYSLKLDKDGYPNIQDFFPILSVPQGRRSVVDKSFDFDIERIDVNKFKKKMEKFAIGLIDNKTFTDNTTFTDTRRQKMMYTGWLAFNDAKVWILKAKLLDLMLQLIYMARHSIQSIERSKYFSTKDTGYRIAFTYTRLRRLWRRMMDIYTRTHKIVDVVKTNYDRLYYYYDTEKYILSHMRVIKLHTDFLNLWWVLIKVDGKYTEMLRATSTTTRTTTTQTVTLAPGETINTTETTTGRPLLTRPETTTAKQRTLPPGVTAEYEMD